MSDDVRFLLDTMRAFVVCEGTEVILDPCPPWHDTHALMVRMHEATGADVRVDFENLAQGHPREPMLLLSADGSWRELSQSDDL